MKTLYAGLTALLICSTAAVAEWEFQHGIPFNGNLYSITAVDSLRAWATGSDGAILKTTDGGIHWFFPQEDSSHSSSEVWSVAFRDSLTGLVCGSWGINRTIDGGSSWVGVNHVARTTWESVWYGQDGSAWAVGWTNWEGIEGIVAHSSDDGQTWVNQILTHSYLYGVAATGIGHAWATGHNVFTTSDSGQSWQNSSLTAITYDIVCVDDSVGWVAGRGPYIARTTDGGVTWTDQGGGSGDTRLYGITAIDRQHAWAVGANGTILSTVDSGTTWTPQASGVTDRLREVAFANERCGWAVGDFATLLRTTDGGTNWQTIGSLIQLPIFDGVDFDEFGQHGWAVGQNSAIFHTTDGGESWQEQDCGEPGIWIADVACLSTDSAVVVGIGGHVLRTTDGGETWSNAYATEFFLDGLHFQNSSVGWAVGAYGTILKTMDSGVSWQPQTSGTIQFLTEVSFADLDNGCAVSDNGVILYTTNGGATWLLSSGVEPRVYYSVDLAADGHGWAVGSDRIILYTTDTGATWTPQMMSGSGTHQAVAVSGNDGAIATDEHGNILRTTDRGETWAYDPRIAACSFTGVTSANGGRSEWAVGQNGVIVRATHFIDAIESESPPAVAREISLAVYPNPFNPETTISFDLPRADRVTLHVYDISGRQIARLADEPFRAGSHALRFDGSELASGIYFARLETAQTTRTTKLVLLK